MDIQPEDKFEAWMRRLEAAVGGGDPREHDAVLKELDGVPDLAVAPAPPRVVRLLEACLLKRVSDDERGGFWSLEFWLNRSADTPKLRPRLEALAVRQIYRGSQGDWRSIAYVVADHPVDGVQREEDAGLRAMRERLLRTMLTSSRDALSGLSDVIVNDAARDRWTIDVLLDAPDAAWELMEPGLLRSALGHDWFADRLVSEMRRRGYKPHNPRLSDLI